MNTENTVKIGNISVDAGLCWIGDPCYILHTKTPKNLGKNWLDFCKKIEKLDYKEFIHDSGANGLGVVVSTGNGDGVYPVFAQIKNDTIKKIWIDFF